VFVFLCYCGVLFCFLTNVDVRLLHLNKPVSQSVSQTPGLGCSSQSSMNQLTSGANDPRLVWKLTESTLNTYVQFPLGRPVGDPGLRLGLRQVPRVRDRDFWVIGARVDSPKNQIFRKTIFRPIGSASPQIFTRGRKWRRLANPHSPVTAKRGSPTTFYRDKFKNWPKI